jgi:hypothetical protein
MVEVRISPTSPQKKDKSNQPALVNKSKKKGREKNKLT